ncbi:MAG TPA: amidase [Acidimicrobiia bacterium]
MTGAETAAAVSAGEISAVESITRALEAADRLQPTLNAFNSIDGEGALARAADLDRRRQAGEPLGPMAGVPVGLKDIIDHAGKENTAGSGFYRHTPERSAPAVGSLEAAGAVIIGRTGLHEFAFGFSSENPWFGPVRNPWDPNTSPGGSSGGSAVAVSAGITPVAIGTDTGGSVRVPAAMCGALGLKVTFGRISTEGVFPLCATLDTVGPLATSVVDLDLSYRVLAELPSGPVSPSPLKGLRLGVPRQWIDDAPKSEEMSRSFEQAAAELQELGAELVEISDQLMVPFGKAADVVGPEVASVHRKWWDEGKPYGEDTAARMAPSMAVGFEAYVEGQAWRAKLARSFARSFTRVDLLITPAVAARRKVIGVEEIEGVHYRTALSWYSMLVNHAGCPALSLPHAAEGSPPFSLQLIAPWWQEDRLLGVAAWLEREGWAGFTVPPVSASN